ncbi:MAG TPA: MFS transporter [Planctomycetota bacterium]
MADNRKRLFIAACAALTTNAMFFGICTDIMGDFEKFFKLTKLEVGQATSWGAIFGTTVLFLGGALLDYVGIGTALWLACAAHTLGLTAILLAQGFWSLTLGWTLLAIAGSLVEAAINPLGATLYPEKKVRVMNVLHAWWPGGIIIGGLLGAGISGLLQVVGASEATVWISWQIKMGCVYVPIVFYAFLIFRQKFPQTERAQAGVPAKVMLSEALRPMFLLLVICMFLTASTELAPNRWVGVFVNDIIGKTALGENAWLRGVLCLVYGAGLMFVLRLNVRHVERLLSPTGILLASSVVSCAGLLCLSYATTIGGLFVAATVFSVGVAYYWPTMLGVTAERFPKGGAFLLGVIGAMAGLFLAYVSVPAMGKMHDEYTLANTPAEVKAKVVENGRVDAALEKKLAEPEKNSLEEARRSAAKTTFRWVAAFPAALIIIFGAIALAERGRKKEEPVLQPQPAEETTSSGT